MVNPFIAILNILLPRQCEICEKPLSNNEEFLCTSCNGRYFVPSSSETFNNYSHRHFFFNPAVKHVLTPIPYRHGTPISILFSKIKYHHRPDIARTMARIITQEYSHHPIFENVDYIIPIPITTSRLIKRGYNQSWWIARGITDVTHIPIENKCVYRQVNNKTQTRKNKEERFINVKHIFNVKHPERLEGKRIILVDDITTTGATLMSCIDTLSSQIKNIEVNVFCLAFTWH